MNLDLTALIPNKDQIDKDRLNSVQTRLVTLLRDQYPDIDVSPNSVFYDNVLRPAAYVLAGSEQAVECVLGDLDLANIVSGNICDCDFVKAYLKTLGAGVNTEIPSVATVRLAYSTDVAHTVQNSARFVFSDIVVLRPLTALAGSISIVPVATTQETKTSNVYRLNRAVDGTYFVDLPVYGATETELDLIGTTGTTDVSDEDLVSVALVSPVVPFTEPELVQDLAKRAQKAFPSASLTTRSSAVSFFTHKFSNLAGASSVMPGDAEMTRGGANLFGVQRNAVDIFPKGKSLVRSAQAVIALSKDTDRTRWVGRMSLPHVPLRLRKFESPDGSALTVQKIVGASTSDAFPGLSGAFSPYEELGVEIALDEGVIDAEITIENTPDVYTAKVFDATTGAGTATLNGYYTGHIFSGSPTQKLSVTDNGDNTFTLSNEVTGEQVDGMTLSGSDLNLTSGDAVYLVERWVGDAMTITIAGTAGDSVIPIAFDAEQGRVIVTYDYDPFINEATQLLEHDTLKGAFDIAVLAARPLVFSKVKIEYRTEFGRWVDTGLALTSLDNYVNQSIYPDNFEDSRLSDILFYSGARGVRAITKTGVLYATLATHYSTDRLDEAMSASTYLIGDGTDYDASVTLNWVNEPLVSVINLDNTAKDSVLGQRNVQYLLDKEDITLVEHRT